MIFSESEAMLINPTEVRSKIMAIVGPKLPKGKGGQETIAKIDRIIELEAKRQDPKAFLYILNNFLKPSDAAYKKIEKLLSTGSHQEKIDEVVKMPSEEKVYGLPNLKCFERLHANVVRRLGQNWEYTGKIYPNDIKEHIRYFINLCNKEGRGESAKPTSLKDVFVGNLSKDIEAELKEYYNAR